MTARRRTRAELEQALRDAADRESDLKGCLERARMEMQAAQQSGHDLRKKLDEVKERCAFLETENARLNGYLDRVREDDIVREELVTVGEPGGDQHLVPKRKHTPPLAFVARRDDFIAAGAVCDSTYMRNQSNQRPRHWVTY